MAYSFNFNSVDMGPFGLIVTSHDLPFLQASDIVQLQDRAWGFDSYRPPIPISLSIAVTATSRTALKTALDNICKTLNLRTDGNLILDIYNDRYYLARFSKISGGFRSPRLWQGSIDFNCHDPIAYGTTEISNDYSINADPKTVTETTGGTGMISPVFTLTAGANLVGAVIKLKNDDTGEELTWTGDINIGEKLTIDVEHWKVELNGASSMSSVTGRFPRLLPDQANSIIVTGFGILGDLNITYRDRYV